MTARQSRRARAAAIAVGLLSAGLLAQEEPVVIGGAQRQERQTFSIERPQASVSLVGTFNQSTSKSGSTETETTETIFQEILGMTTRAFVLSPNFIDLNLAGAFGFEQTEIDSNSPLLAGEDGKGNEQTYEYDATANILRLSGAPLTLFARRSEDIVTQPFGSSYESTADSFGAAWQIKHRTLPTNLRYQHVELTQTTLGGQLDFASTEDIISWNTSWRPTSNQTLNWDYQFSSSQTEGGVNDEEEQTHDARLDHTLTFGRDNRSRLESSLDYYDETGTTPYNRLRWSERLTVRHSPVFETRYNYDFSQYNFGDTETTSHRGSAAFTHWLYQSLVTTGTFSSGIADANDSSTTDWIADLTLDYRKKVPLGTFLSTLGAAYSSQSSEARADAVQVLDQSATFTDFQPLLIPQQNIAPNSIRITQPRAAGEEVFIEGIDYIVTPVPTGVEIRRVGTNIPSGEPVLLDYTVEPQGASDTTTSAFSLSGRYVFEESWLKGFSPYGRFQVQQQDVSASGVNPPLPNDITAYTLGAEYRIWYLFFRAEHQIIDSTLLPLEITRLRAEWLQDVRVDLRTGASVEYTMISYTDTGDETDALTITANAEYRLSRHLLATAHMSWIHQTDSVSGVTDGWDQEVALRWRYRQTQLYGSVRHTNLTTEDLETDNLLFQIGFERKF